MSARSITPNDPANFTPTLGDYKELRPFRFWCQKVLPLVYDDSLSYYELLCKVVDYLNKTMEDVDTLEGDVTNLHTAYEQLQDYVNNYFSTLDVQEEINNKLDNMAKNGELLELVLPIMRQTINEWLSSNITNPTNPPLDKTLTLENSASESKTVGDTFKKYVETFYNILNCSKKEFTDYIKITDAKEGKAVLKKYNENVIYDYSVANGNNLIPWTVKYPLSKVLDNNAYVSINESGVIKYDGTNAEGENIEFDLCENDKLLFKLPFDCKISTIFTVKNGGFDFYIYYTVNGEKILATAVNNPITLPKGAIINRVYIRVHELNSVFNTQITMTPSNETEIFDKPTLSLFTNDVQIIDFKYGLNYIFPNFIGEPVENSVIYIPDNENVITLQQNFELENGYDYTNKLVNIPYSISNQKFLNRDKQWLLNGKNKKLSIIKCNDVNYQSSIVELCSGLINNLTLSNITDDTANNGYCIHLDSNLFENDNVLISNCYIHSLNSICIGIGTRANSELIIENCVIECENDKYYPLYLHNTESTGNLTSKVTFKNCIFISKGETCIRLQDWNNTCNIDFLFINNTLIVPSEYNIQNSVKIEYHNYDTSEEITNVWKNRFTLNKGSHGNNVDILNA